MKKIKSLMVNRHNSRELYKPWLWIGLFLARLTTPIHPGLYFVNFLFQRIFRVNGMNKFMVHYTSYVYGKVTMGKNVWVSFATSGNCYIQGDNGIAIGDNTIFAPGVKIISANHNPNDYSKQISNPPITIGKSCWIGSNAVILPGIQLGDHVIVGAGAVVSKSFPSNVVLAGVPAKIIKQNNLPL